MILCSSILSVFFLGVIIVMNIIVVDCWYVVFIHNFERTCYNSP